MPNFCEKCGTRVEESARYCPMCGQPAAFRETGPVPQAAGRPAQPEWDARPSGAEPPTPMKWFKFIIYFQLFFSAFVLLVTAITQLTGIAYGDAADVVYLIYPGLHAVDLIMGLLELALAALAIYVRQLLAKFRAKGPDYYLILIGINLAVSLIYALIASLIIGQSVFSASVIGNLVGSAAMIVINKVYFGKRRHLFVN